MALPAEPRQKMINLMYLVLTALLALNVSAEILNAFKTVDRSLINTNATINHSTETILNSLKDKLADNDTREKAAIWLPKAQAAASLTKDMDSYIQNLKNEIYNAAGLDFKKNGDSSFKQDNLDITTRLMVDEKRGQQLHDRLAKYKTDLLAIDPAIAQQFSNSLQVDVSMPPVQDKANKTWEAAYFHMVPTVAAITMLSKFQNDVKTSENKVVAFCHEQVGKVVVRFDTFNAIVGQSTNYAMPGQEIEIMAGVGAFSKVSQPTISINGANTPLGDDGAAHAKIAGGGLGTHSVPVHIVYKDQDGKVQTIDKVITYTVGQANASIALDKMNVLYIGVDNPISVAASGGGDDKTQVTISGGGGNVSKSGSGKYNVRVNSITDDAVITVLVDGKPAGASKFRVRTIPPPGAFVGGYESGSNVAAGTFANQAGVGAGIKNFPFELKYTVSSFSISCDNSEGDIDVAENTGNVWGARAMKLIRDDVKAGRMVTIDNIKVLGPDGRTTPAPSLIYYIK